MTVPDAQRTGAVAQARTRALREAAALFAERFRAAVPADRAALLEAFLLQHPAPVLGGQTLWTLHLDDRAAFDAGLDAVLSRRPDHLLALRLHAWREARAGRHEHTKQAALRALAAQPRQAKGHDDAFWLGLLRRAELMAPSASAGARQAIWDRCVAAAPPGLPRAALRMQRAISVGRAPDGTRFEALLAQEAEAALTLPAPEAMGGEPMRARLGLILHQLRAARDIALVGNAPTHRGMGAGAEIDRHDVVVRCNYPPIAGYEADVGQRTDLMLLHGSKRHELAARLATAPGYPAIPALSCSSPGPADLPPPPPPDDQPRPAAPDAVERLLDALSYPGRTIGMSGAVLLGLVLGRPVRLFGFDSFRAGGAGHYYGSAQAAPHHDLAYERWYLTRVLPTVRPQVTLHASAT